MEPNDGVDSHHFLYSVLFDPKRTFFIYSRSPHHRFEHIKGTQIIHQRKIKLKKEN